MTNKELHDYMKDLKEEFKTEMKDIKEELHDLAVRITKIETLYKVAGWFLASSGFLGMVLAIIHIFKSLTN